MVEMQKKCGFSLCPAVSVAVVTVDLEPIPVCAEHLGSVSALHCPALTTAPAGDVWQQFAAYEAHAKRSEDLGVSASQWWRLSHCLFTLPPPKRESHSDSESPLKKPKV